jgi:(2Fe-2S) ferredoxin
MGKLKNIEDFRKLKALLMEETFKAEVPRVRLCSGTACTATGSAKVVTALEEEAAKRGIPLDVVKTGCQGLCQKGPVMKVEPQGIFYQKVKPDHAKSIMAYTVVGGAPYRQSLYRNDFMS